MKTLHRAALLLAALGLVFATGCNKKAGDAAKGAAKGAAKAAKGAIKAATAKAPGFIELIPADSPYVFASLEPVPAEVMDKFFTALAPLTAKADAEMGKALAKAKAGQGTDDKVAAALIEEFKGNLNKKGLEKMGISTTPSFALYGVGVLPVFRFELKDPKAFKDLIARVEKKAGQKAPTMKAGEQEYWGFTDDGVHVAIAIIKNELVFTMGPEPAAKLVIPYASGQKKPAKHIGAAGTLKNIASAHGYKNYGIGYVDLVAIAKTVMGDSTGVSKEVFTALAAGMPALPPMCKTEIMGMVNKAPRLVVGYTEFSKAGTTASYVLELEGGLAKSLAGLSAPVPGLGGKDALGAVASLGLGLDIPKTIAFAKAQVAAMKAKPYQCPMLADLNSAVGDAEKGLSQPYPPFINGIQGVNVVLKSGDFAGGQPKNLKGYAVLAAKDPKGLLAAAKAMNPGMPLNLSDDGTPMAFPLPPPAVAVVGAVHIAMKGQAIVATIGEGEQKNIKNVLGMKPEADKPIAAISYDVKAITAAAGAQMGSEEKQIVEALGGMFGKSAMKLSFTEKGVVISQKTQFN